MANASPAMEHATMDIERETESAIESLRVSNVSDDNVKSNQTDKPQANQKKARKDNLKDNSQDIPKDKSKVFDIVEKMPSFPGGNVAMVEYLSKNVNYPKVAEEKRIEGRVIACFVVEKDGSISNAEIVKSVNEELDAEALRVIGSMPRW